MQNLKIYSSVLFFAALVAGAMSFSQPPRWELLGSRKIDYALDRDDIMVTAGEGMFTALKLKIHNAPINMHKIVVHYGNGESQEFDFRHNFAAGSESRVIDLAGNRRVIHHVTMWYDTKNLAARKGEVELWGRH